MNYQLIKDESKLQNFIDWLPKLKASEDFDRIKLEAIKYLFRKAHDSIRELSTFAQTLSGGL